MKFDCGGGIQHSFASNRFYVTIQLNKLKSEAKIASHTAATGFSENGLTFLLF